MTTIYEMTDEQLNEYMADLLGRIERKEGNIHDLMAENKELYEEKEHRKRKAEGRLLDGWDFPVMAETGNMVRCIHEATCPTCGRYVDRDSYTSSQPQWLKRKIKATGQEWLYEDWTVDEIECPAGHKHTAEPSEGLSDWVAY